MVIVVPRKGLENWFYIGKAKPVEIVDSEDAIEEVEENLLLFSNTSRKAIPTISNLLIEIIALFEWMEVVYYSVITQGNIKLLVNRG